MLDDPAGLLVTLIELAGSLLIAGYCLAATIDLIRRRDPVRARLLVIEGALWGLSLKTAASLLKTIEIQSWNQIGAFAAILTLRTLVRQVMSWEKHHLV